MSFSLLLIFNVYDLGEVRKKIPNIFLTVRKETDLYNNGF